MKHTNVVLDLAQCPKCQGKLREASDGGVACEDCNSLYPEFGNIIWLFEEPHYMRADWKNRFDYFLQMNRLEVQKLKIQQQAPHLLDNTKKRLSKLIQSKIEHGREVSKAIEPIVSDEDGDPAIHLAAGTKLPETQALMSYYDNICRDWSYGDEENKICLDTIANVLGDNRSLGKLAVLGSGACRLAYDIHRNFEADLTLNIDINPFLFFVAQRLVAGKAVNLYEFPMAPKNLESVAVKLKCKAPETIKDGFHFLLSDAMNPSFQAEAFNTLLTPWLIDIVHQDIRDQFRRYNRLLQLGGRWINFGSLAFFHRDSLICYSLEETLDIAKEAGFEIESYSHEEIPYLHSPYSCQKRYERVLCFSARKVNDVEQPEQAFNFRADWLRDTNLAVPLSQEVQQQTMVHNTLQNLFQLVDGKRSIQDMAQEATFLGVPPENAVLIIQNVLTKFFDDRLKGRQF
ncbi:hypothetical protein [Pseudobacteriovorax antillogorgiicola]|uniref:N2227-like protein n=1 Tax=Pseudobacteriovorax antillogorgiicola TaxID=1513793 RepID=A0A1Y6C1I3_9BACT|nr:hypothetical protein [Pseudobacteriovorax antillogorgiicola]TCS52411.1 N2227-like protein [Pseudobacteriovorax antillogorgiicola]SMF28847.1 N2227-like protein [Pseudobacteriovorax antillogorgiicola]